jgi:hypothetical protein
MDIEYNPANDMSQRVRFAWAFLRRHRIVNVVGLDGHYMNDMIQLCMMELAQLAVDHDGNPVCFFLRCASDAMFPES